MSPALRAQDLVWAKRAGGTSSDTGNGIAVDGAGNSYVTGQFIGSATFGTGETNETTLTSAGNRDLFVAKYDASGDLVWAKRAGGASFISGSGIALDGSGNSYVTGRFLDSATFGPGETNETTLTSVGDTDIFVAQYDAAGDLVWAKRAGGARVDAGSGIAVDGAGNSYVTGFFGAFIGGSATFGPGETNETTLTSAGFIDIFVAKYDASGDLVWAKRAGGTSDDLGRGIAVDGAGNSYVTGSFEDSATFGPGETNETTLTSAGFDDIFVAKYDASGDLVWAKRAGGIFSDEGRDIAVDGAGNSYVTGFFGLSATFGPGETNEITLTNAGSFDIFVVKYDASGDLVWAKRAGSTSSNFSANFGQGIAVDGAGNSYSTGFFGLSAIFGPGETNETTLTSAGFDDIFVAKYDASGDLVWAKRAGGTVFDEGNGIAVDGAGNSYVTGAFDGSATFGPGETNETTLTSAGVTEIFVAKYDVPTADAGTDQLVTVAPGDTAMVTLDGSGSSDPAGDPLTFTWTNSFGTAMGVMPTVPLAPGVHVITLTVDDGKGGTDTDTVKITVNQAPVAVAGSDQTRNAILGTATLTLDGSGSSDPDSDPLTFTWTGPFGAVGGATPTVTLPGGVHTIMLAVDDGRGGIDTDTVIIAVAALEVSPSSLGFTFGKGVGASQSLSIRSVGGLVRYFLAGSRNWLRTMPEGGESTGETDTIQVLVDPALSPGTYSTTLVIRGNGNIMARIPVTMVVPEGGVPAYPQLRLPDNPAVDTADFIPHGEPGHAMAGKSIIAIFGEGFVAEGEFRAETVPLPTKLGGVRVLFDGTAAPLYLVTGGLIHAQLPMGLLGPTATLRVVRDFQKAQSNPREIEIHDYSPGIFTLSQNGEGQAIAVLSNTPDLAAPVGAVGNSRPAAAGDHLTIYANGLGPVEPPLLDGHNSCEPDGVCLPDGSNVVLHETTTKPIIRIGGVQVPEENLVFSGSSVTSVGVNELVFKVPPGLPTCPDVSLTIEIGGVVSKDGVTMAVE